MNVHDPRTIYSIVTGLAACIRLQARLGEAVNALIHAIRVSGGPDLETEVEAPNGAVQPPESYIPDEFLLVLLGELDALAAKIEVRTTSLRRMRSPRSADGESDVSRETSEEGKSFRSRERIIQHRTESRRK